MNERSFRKLLRSTAIITATALAACGGTMPTQERSSAKDIQVIVEASDLASAFESSEAHANELYTGKRARISGTLSRVEALSDGRIAMNFKISKDTFRPVRCIFDAKAATSLNRFAGGDHITFTGDIRGFSESRYFVTVDGCVVE